MKFIEAKLPWNDLPVWSTGDLYAWLSEKIPSSLQEYLPGSVNLLFDQAVDQKAVLDFLDELPQRLISEFRRRQARISRFIELDLFTESEIHSFLTGHRYVQPWILYYSTDGGLGFSAHEIYKENAAYGVVPCETMPNHGVAWKQVDTSHYHVWLATAPKEGQGWNWEVNIGHESAHSAFAPVPLFAQAVNHSAEAIHLSDVKTIDNLEPTHLAQMGYMYSEVAVSAVRGEQRLSETGLPGAEKRDQLYALLSLSNELMPTLGFDKAFAAAERANGSINTNEGDEIFEIGAAVMRVIPHLAKIVQNFEPPTSDWYRSIHTA